MVGGLYQAGRCALDAIVRNDSRIERGDDPTASRDGLPGQRGLRGLGFERRDGGAAEGDVLRGELHHHRPWDAVLHDLHASFEVESKRRGQSKERRISRVIGGHGPGDGTTSAYGGAMEWGIH